MDKYTITNPNLLVEELEGNLKMKVNVKGELKELIDTKQTTNTQEEIQNIKNDIADLDESVRELESCCESQTNPLPQINARLQMAIALNVTGDTSLAIQWVNTVLDYLQLPSTQSVNSGIIEVYNYIQQNTTWMILPTLN